MSEYDRHEFYSTPVTLTIQGDAGGFQVALEAHVEDHDKIDEHLDKMRRSFIRQQSYMRLTLVLADLEQKRQELRDSPAVLEAIQKTYVVKHAEMVASFQQQWQDRDRLGDYKASTTERENLRKLRTDSDAQIAAVKAQMESLPIIIRQYEERVTNLRNLISGKDRHEALEEAFARQVLVEHPPQAAE